MLNSNRKVYEISSKKDLKAFINLPWTLYQNDKNWVPPLKKDMMNILRGKNNPLFMNGTHTFFMIYDDGQPVGRILVGINEKLNRKKDKNEGYISLFECINSKEAANLLFDAAVNWLKKRKITRVVGPVSPTNGDDSKGLLVRGFNGSPVLMNSYNPPYYPQFFEEYGFIKDLDLYAYHFDPNNVPIERFKKVVGYAMEKFHFKIDKINLKNLKEEAKDIKIIIDLSMPDSWEYLTPPSLAEITAEINNLKPFADKDLIYIARSSKTNEPIGFVVAIPDYNQVLKKMNGSMFPLGVIKYLWYKRKIDGLRAFIQFVVPKYRNKAVNSAIFYRLMIEANKKNFTYGEGSTITENNSESKRSVEKAGGKLYRIYRIYGKDI